jgi:MFS superfamily sulfate permease-like transporter
VLFCFNVPLTFFGEYFKQRALAAADTAGKDVRWFVIDAIPISDIDMNGLYALRDLNAELEARGTALIFAGWRTEFLIWLRQIGLYRMEWDNRLFPTLSQALKAFRHETTRAESPPRQRPNRSSIVYFLMSTMPWMRARRPEVPIQKSASPQLRPPL